MSRVLVLVSLLIIFASLSLSEAIVRYDGWKVVRALLASQKQIKSVDKLGLDVWSHDSSLVIGYNDIRVTDEHLRTLRNLGITFEPFIDDVQELIENEQRQMAQANAVDNWFSAYHTYAEITIFLQNLTTVYPDILKFIPSVGKTNQGQEIVGVFLSTPSTNPKKKVFVSGGQHAREWIAPATVLYILQSLLADEEVQPLLDQFQIYFVPSANPDGYAYAWSTDRLWRKNRRANVGGSFGVDLNRNWNDHWGGEGSSGNPTSDTYRGTAPFSEPETQTISNFILAIGPLGGSIDYHSYSQLVIYPYGWTFSPAPTQPLLHSVALGWKDSIFGVTGVNYTAEPGSALYISTGGVNDWSYSEAHTTLSYTIELRDTGRYGFVLPPDQIIPTGQENYAGFLYFLESVLKHA